MNRDLYDYLIIGQGIAGSVLAMSLIEQGKRVFVFDSPNPNTSSKIAAGIMNPITGKRMTVTWKADDFFPEAIEFYSRMESYLNSSFLSQHAVVRIFSSVAEQNDWSAKWNDDKYHNFVLNDISKDSINDAVPCPYGSLKVTGGGRLDTNMFIGIVKEKLSELNCYQERHVSHKDLECTSERISLYGVEANHVVFCTGHDRDLWNFLPFTPMKGEVLELESQDLNSTDTLVGGCFLSPSATGTYYAGATYDWKNVNLERTESAKKDILDKVSRFTTADFSVKAHRVGIRPAVKDRRPLLGAHPSLQNVYLFSGMGSKGVSMTPYLAKCLQALIEQGVSLDKEMDLNRFVK